MDHDMTVDDLTCEWEEDGQLTVEQLEKFVLTKGAWATIMYMYRERKGEGWTEPKARVQRYRKQKGRYSSQSKFNISSAKQAQQIIKQLTQWFPEEA